VDPPGVATTYAGLARRVEGTAATWAADGLRPGDTVAVAASNSTDHLVALLAAARAGMVLVGLPAGSAPARWAYLLGHAGARLVQSDPEQAAAAWEAAALAGVPSEQVADLRMMTSGTAPWAYDPERDRPEEDATFQVVYTSGTTGRPKASRVVHRCSVHSAMSYQRVLRLQAGERTAVLFSLGYISALHAHVLPAMLAGAACVLTSPGRPGTYARLLAEHEVAWAYAVPSWWSMVAADPGFCADALPALRLVGAGGSPFPRALQERLRERVPHARLLNVYGLSETHSPATILLPSELAARPDSCGRALPCMEVAVRVPSPPGTAGADLPAGEVGEVWLRGSLVTPGYAGDEEATRAALVDGWFRTGDLGRLDSDGYLTLVDRVKDMINRAGEKVYSAEVEAALREHPSVGDAAVVAGPDPRAGETVVAYVVPRAEDDPPATPELRRWVRERVGERAAPSRVHLVPELPRTGTGKADKGALRERARGAP